MYNTKEKYQIVIDTNVVVSALRSKRGASHKLVSLVGAGLFDIHLSVPLILEYEDALNRQQSQLPISGDDITTLVDSLCSLAKHHDIYFLWRPQLRDPGDEMLLELAVKAQCHFIVTYNAKDFAGIERFGIDAITPKSFLQLIGAIP
jgi:putative PIN family toxin of toxin-antitoxin system